MVPTRKASDSNEVLDIDRIAAAAMTVVTEHGARGLTMRAVAAVLDVTPTALYHHIENKAELVALLVGKVIRENPLPSPTGKGWGLGLLDLARWARDALVERPAVAQLQLQFKVWHPATLAMGEQWVSLWQQSGLPFDDAIQAAQLSSMAILGFIQQEVFFQSFEPPSSSEMAFLPNLRSMYDVKLDPSDSFELLVLAVIGGLHRRLTERPLPEKNRGRA
jgi:AcrR family transcriptional regulator